MYILDTNAVYYLINPDWTSSAQLARLHERAASGKLRVAIPPITILELASRVVEEPDWFAAVQSAAKAALELRPLSLPDPEQRMREITEGVDLAQKVHAHWLEILATMAKAPTLDALRQGFDDYTTATRRSANVVDLAKYRDEYERQYLLEMGSLVRAINPKYEEQVQKGGMTKLSKEECESLRKFFVSPEWGVTFLSMLASRGGTGVIPTEAGKMGVVVAKAKYFQDAYEGLCLSMFCDGARPNLKRKNDYNDIHQLLYLNEYSGDVLVSEDAGVLVKAGGPKGKVISFKEFLQREAS
jgi:predicted nucleic acid-binding protein